jgi:hypothetical protein
MKRTILVALLGMLAVVLPACLNQAPAYRAELLTFDEGLEGTWVLVAPTGDEGDKSEVRIPIEVSRREAVVTADRLGEYNDPSSEPVKRYVPAYTFSIKWPRKNSPTPRVQTYNAVLLRVSGETFMAYEPKSIAESDLVGDVLPVHRIVCLRRQGDTLTCTSLKVQLVWVAGLRIPYDTSRVPELPTQEGTYLVENPEHLTTLLERSLSRPELWNAPLVITRDR